MSWFRRLIIDSVLSNYIVFQIGKTKVFLRAGQMAELDACRSEVLGKSASIIQQKVRSYFARKSFIVLRISAVQLQAVCRGMIGAMCFNLHKYSFVFKHWTFINKTFCCLTTGEVGRHLYQCMRREAACLRIQRDARTFLAKKAYRTLCSSCISIQTGMRGMVARNELQFRKRTQAAIFIQVNLIVVFNSSWQFGGTCTMLYVFSFSMHHYFNLLDNEKLLKVVFIK